MCVLSDLFYNDNDNTLAQANMYSNKHLDKTQPTARNIKLPLLHIAIIVVVVVVATVVIVFSTCACYCFCFGLGVARYLPLLRIV